MDEETPPVRRLKLRPNEPLPTEERSLPGDGTAFSVSLAHHQNEIAEAKAAALPKVEQPPPPEDPEAIRIHDMLRQNLRAAQDPRSELIAMPERRRSRRNRDFLMLVGAALVADLVLSLIFRKDLRVIALAQAAIGTLTAMLAWIIYGVMDHY
jgi:hypothetical protein